MTIKVWAPTSLDPKSNKAALGVLLLPPHKCTPAGRGSAPAREMAVLCSEREGCLAGSKGEAGRGMQVTDAGREGQMLQAGAAALAGGFSRCYLGCSPTPWSDRSDPASSRSPRQVSEAACRRQRQREPAGERVRGGAAGVAGEGGKAHPVGTRGRTAAAWRSSLGYPSWSPRPGTLFEPEAVPQTEWPAAAASSGRRLSRAV